MPEPHTDVAAEIIAMEEAALARWGKGDPSGFLEICDPAVTYFDPYAPARVDGLPALTALYESFRGQVKVDTWKLLNPVVAVHGEVAVLTFNYVSTGGGGESRWNCTEVYRATNEGWRIIQTHWSYTEGGRRMTP